MPQLKAIPAPGCVSPLTGYQPKPDSLSERKRYQLPLKDTLVFPKPHEPLSAAFTNYFTKIDVSCGQCMPCRLKHSMEWAGRIMAEATLYERNCFITLTYDDEHLPENNELVKKHLQDFKKRLRAKYSGHNIVPGIKLKPGQKNPIRTYDAGEYGDQFGRPHYHQAVMNFKPFDLKPFGKNKQGDTTYTSKSLSKLWGHGFVTIGDLTAESASYVSRYVTKKINGKAKDEHYRQINQETGELYTLPQEFATMSRKPGVGIPFLNKYPTDLLGGKLHIKKGNGKILQRNLPKLFETKLSEMYPEIVEKLKQARIDYVTEMQLLHPEEFTPERRAVKLQVYQAQTKSIQRTQGIK